MLSPRAVLAVAATVPEGQRLYFLNAVLRDRVEEARAATLRALDWHRRLQKCTETVNGVPSVRVIVWQRDCDHCEGWHSYVCPVADLQKRIEHDLRWADGPMVHHLGWPSVTRTLPQGRDHVLEAHEDGHAWSVSL